MGGIGSGRRPCPDIRARNVKIGRLYRGGASLRQVGERYGISKKAVSDALEKMGVPRRRKGARPDQQRVAAPPEAQEQAQAFCEQCDRLVAARCASPFCKATGV